MTANPIPLELLPDTAQIVEDRLLIGGCDVIEVAERFGTSLFIYDEAHLRSRCREAVDAFGDGVAYASKAFLCKAMAKIAYEAGMEIDVATGGEMHIALAAGVPGSSLVFHGNNKSSDELMLAIDSGIGRIVVDSFDEMDRIEALVAGGRPAPGVLVRINPGIDAHTHEYLQTGIPDSKFGFPLTDGIAAKAIHTAQASEAMRFRGLHAHIGSQVFDVENYGKAIEALAPFVNESRVEEFSIGGGLGVAYVEGEEADTITVWAQTILAAAKANGITAKILAEPGRSIVARAAVTAYTVGTIKDLPGVRTYVSVDGGISENPRPVLYGSGYEAMLPRSAEAARPMQARIVGMHCEAGDIIVREAHLPEDTVVGDILCTPVTGAYGHSMGSNYNKVARPAVVFVANGEARLVIERETFDDMLVRDVG
ncbi:MAG: diaminopimelate decarboxylase [Acidimicrobiia bacterium]|nr:MAG: diaminopimelate decarboxylase [Acidimicrobiia bacterium]